MKPPGFLRLSSPLCLPLSACFKFLRMPAPMNYTRVFVCKHTPAHAHMRAQESCCQTGHKPFDLLE